jgi:SAM-dependent methyltransferase
LSYYGVDIEKGMYVDEICDILDLTKRFKREEFDIVVCTEVIEHVEDWRNGIKNLMEVTKVGGIMLLTSRSKGFGIHGFPKDYWRYEIEDIEKIFENWEIIALEKDLFINPNNGLQDHYGFFLKALKKNTILPDLDNHLLFNIATDPRHNPDDSKLERTLNF